MLLAPPSAACSEAATPLAAVGSDESAGSTSAAMTGRSVCAPLTMSAVVHSAHTAGAYLYIIDRRGKGRGSIHKVVWGAMSDDEMHDDISILRCMHGVRTGCT